MTPRIRAWLRAVFGRPAVPAQTLATYRHERMGQLTLPVAFGLLQGGFVAVIADKIYAVHAVLLALVTAAPMFANLSSALWARLALRVPVVRLLVAVLAAHAVAVGAIALLPASSAGGPLLVGFTVVAHLLLAGFITVRSLVWTRNYPPGVRSRMTSRLSLVAVALMAAVAAGGGALLDGDPERFRWIYAAGALLAVAGTVAYARVELAPPAAVPSAAGAAVPAAALPTGVFRILRDDPLFARYLGWQFLLGTANMMIEAPLVILVSRELGASYTTSVALTVALPLGLSILAMPLWAGYLDRVHVTRFRARQGWMWVGSQLLTFVGAATASLAWIGAGRALLGAARSGGMIAWQIGHNDFAHPDRAGLYMGLHATLTGLRGAIAPFLGVALYVGWAERAIPALPFGLPGWAGIGAGVWLVGAALSLVSTLGFARLARQVAEAAERDRERTPDTAVSGDTAPSEQPSAPS